MEMDDLYFISRDIDGINDNILSVDLIQSGFTSTELINAGFAN